MERDTDRDPIVPDQGAVRNLALLHGLTRRDFLLAGAGAGAGLYVLGLGGWAQGAEAQAAPPDLDIFTQGYPRSFYGRHVEGVARTRGLTYETFEGKFAALDGIVGKVLNEENYYTGKNNLSFFLRFKQDHPQKMVLLHYNGTGRRATDEVSTKFFPGHFLHYRGTKLTQGIKSRTQTVIHVQDTSVFRTQRYRTAVADDIAIARVDRSGKPLWGTAEQVRLVRIDARNKTITVRRGMYNTRANTYPTGSYLAAHVTTGPYRFDSQPQNNVPLWAYNFSTLCPKDAQGRNCGDALADYLKEKLGPGGQLQSFDGIIFDVFSWVIRFGNPIAEIDVNTDGRADQGIFGGVNTVSKGALAFFQKLRELLPDKILMSDGHIPTKSQRGFEYLNGTESEGYADKYDFTLDHLSRGENIFKYWKEHSVAPSFNSLNFRYKEERPARSRNTFTEPTLSQDKSYRKLRLALASCLFTDSAFTGSGGDLENGGDGWLPPEVTWRQRGSRVRVFDELWKGTEQVPHWLGQPLEPVVRLAERAQDIFEGRGESWPDLFVGRFDGEGVAFSAAGTPEQPIMAIRVVGSNKELSFVLPGVELAGRDLFVSLRLKAEPLENFPASVPRRVSVSATPARAPVIPANKEFTWAGGESFTASLYFQDVGPGTVHLRFEVEGEGQVYFERLTAHSAADGRYREYENGIVFANPSTRSYAFNVGTLLPGVSLRRLQGSPNQDDQTNDGSVVGGQLTLPAKDGLFVVRSEA